MVNDEMHVMPTAQGLTMATLHPWQSILLQLAEGGRGQETDPTVFTIYRRTASCDVLTTGPDQDWHTGTIIERNKQRTDGRVFVMEHNNIIIPLIVATKVAGVALDTTDSENLLLGNTGLFVGLILQDLNVSPGFNHRAASSNQSFILKGCQRLEDESMQPHNTYGFLLCQLCCMHLSSSSVKRCISEVAAEEACTSPSSGSTSTSTSASNVSTRRFAQ
jgi:hypothetical protein